MYILHTVYISIHILYIRLPSGYICGLQHNNHKIKILEFNVFIHHRCTVHITGDYVAHQDPSLTPLINDRRLEYPGSFRYLLLCPM